VIVNGENPVGYEGVVVTFELISEKRFGDDNRVDFDDLVLERTGEPGNGEDKRERYSENRVVLGITNDGDDGCGIEETLTYLGNVLLPNDICLVK